MNALTQPRRLLARDTTQPLISTPDYVSAYNQQPVHWMYDIDPATGVSRATYIGEVIPSGGGSGVSSFNGRTGAVTLTPADIAGAPAVASFNGRTGATTLQQSDLTALGDLNDTGRNYVQNALFNIAQRGNGPFTTTLAYCQDRWQLAFLGGSMSVTVPGPMTDTDRAQIGDEAAETCWQCVFTGGAVNGNYSEVMQKIEDLRRLSGKTVTVSFWAKGATAGLRVGFNLQLFYGTGGSPSPATWATATGIGVATTTAWARYSGTIAIPSTAGMTFGTNGDNALWLTLAFNSVGANNPILGSPGQQSGTISLWGVQLEVSPVMTPLVKRDPADDVRLCQRFYQLGQLRVLGYAAAAGQVIGQSLSFLNSMRGVPTLTPNWTTQTNGTGTLGTLDSSFCYPYATATAAGQVNCGGTYTASADL